MQKPSESEEPVAPFPLDDVLSGEDKDAIRDSISDLLGDTADKPTYHTTSIPEFENAPPRTSTERPTPFIAEGETADSSPAFSSKPPEPYGAKTSNALEADDFLTTAPAAAAAAASKSEPKSKPKPKSEPEPKAAKAPSEKTVAVEVPIAAPSENSDAVKAAAALAPPSKTGAILSGLIITVLGLGATGLIAYLFNQSGKTPQDVLAAPALAVPIISALVLAFGTVLAGLGCLSLKKWARTLALAGSWVAVATGILFLVKILLRPAIFAAAPFPGIDITTYAAAAFVLIPSLLSLYLGSHRATRLFAHHDPKGSTLSAPVIGGSLLMAIGAAGLATLALRVGGPLPLFAGEIPPIVQWVTIGIFGLASLINLSSSKLAWFLVLLPITALLARSISLGLTYWQDTPLPARETGLFVTGIALGLFLYHAAIAPLYGKRAK